MSISLILLFVSTIRTLIHIIYIYQVICLLSLKTNSMRYQAMFEYEAAYELMSNVQCNGEAKWRKSHSTIKRIESNRAKGEGNPSRIAFNLNNNMSCGDAHKSAHSFCSLPSTSVIVATVVAVLVVVAAVAFIHADSLKSDIAGQHRILSLDIVTQADISVCKHGTVLMPWDLMLVLWKTTEIYLGTSMRCMCGCNIERDILCYRTMSDWNRSDEKMKRCVVCRRADCEEIIFHQMLRNRN